MSSGRVSGTYALCERVNNVHCNELARDLVDFNSFCAGVAPRLGPLTSIISKGYINTVFIILLMFVSFCFNIY